MGEGVTVVVGLDVGPSEASGDGDGEGVGVASERKVKNFVITKPVFPEYVTFDHSLPFWLTITIAFCGIVVTIVPFERMFCAGSTNRKQS